MDTSKPNTEIDLIKLRTIANNYIDQGQHISALFWLEKLVTLSSGDPQDVFWYSNVLYNTGQFHRASHLLSSYKLDKMLLIGKYLRARCHFSAGEYQQALSILESQEEVSNKEKDNPLFKLNKLNGLPSMNVDSAISMMLGKIYEALDNRTMAVDCYREALHKDVFCFEAFQKLVQHQMLTAAEEKELLSSLPLDIQCNASEKSVILFLYENMLKKYDRPQEVQSGVGAFSDNLEVMVAKAEKFYYNTDLQSCYDISTEVLKRDIYNSSCLPIHVACLVELKKTNELFCLSHKLVDLYPSSEMSWFAVGCYYFLIGKQELARRFLSKATSLNRLFGPAWLVYGHSFGIGNEHDQAMAAYFSAYKLMKGCHLALLYIGLEYGLTSNLKLADQFFSEALKIAPDDPFVLHEMGVSAFQSLKYEQAEMYFLAAYAKVKTYNHVFITEKWEPLLNNLGHVSRKLKKFEESIMYHKLSLSICPNNASTYTSLGYSCALHADYESATDYLHKSLSIRKEDSFTTTALNSIIELLMMHMNPFPDIPEMPFEQNNALPISPRSSTGAITWASDNDNNTSPQSVENITNPLDQTSEEMMDDFEGGFS